MAQFPALPLFTDAYLADTHPDLNLEQHGCYMLLLQAAWRRPNCDLPDDDKWFCRWLGVHGNKWRKLRISVLERFFSQDETGYWYQKRLRKERDFVEKSSRNRRESGLKGNAVRWKNNDIGDRPAIAPTPTHIKEKEALSEPRKRNPAPDTEGMDNTASLHSEAALDEATYERGFEVGEGSSGESTPKAGGGSGKGTAAVQRGTRCPWLIAASIPDRCQDFARQLGLDPQAVGEQFADYWAGAPGNRGVKLDWPATWRNWCRREAERPKAKRQDVIHTLLSAARKADERANTNAAPGDGRSDKPSIRDVGGKTIAHECVSGAPREFSGRRGRESDHGMAGLPRLVAHVGRT